MLGARSLVGGGWVGGSAGGRVGGDGGGGGGGGSFGGAAFFKEDTGLSHRQRLTLIGLTGKPLPEKWKTSLITRRRRNLRKGTNSRGAGLWPFRGADWLGSVRFGLLSLPLLLSVC